MSYSAVSQVCYSMTPFFFFLNREQSSADGLRLIWSRYAHARPLWTGLGIWDIIRQSVPASQDTWQRDKRDSCDNVNSNISLLFCGGKVSPQNVSIVRDRGTGLRSISTSDSLHFHFNWHLNYQRFNFISVNIKTDSVRVHLSLDKIYQQTITISTEN